MSIIGDIIGAIQHEGDKDFNERQAALNREFQHNEAQLAYERELSADSTKYQRQVQDMAAAGLNPMMAVSAGAGSVHSSPVSGSAASAPGASGFSGLGNLSDLFRLKIEKSLADAEVALKEAQKKKVESETTGQDLENDLFKDTAEVKKLLLGDQHDRNEWEKELGFRGVKVKEDNQRMLEENATHYNEMLDQQSALIHEQKMSEGVKREMYRANAREASQNAVYKAAMLELDKKASEAMTGKNEEEKKRIVEETELLKLEARLKRGVYTVDYIKAVCEDAQAMSEYHSIMTAYSKGDYSAASKDLQKVFREGERVGKNYGMANFGSSNKTPQALVPAL